MPPPVAAIGCRSHSGWAVIVAVTGSAAAPRVLHRERIELVDGSVPAQPYHAVAESGLSPAEGASLIAHVEALSAASAHVALAQLAAQVREEGFGVAGAVVVANDRALPQQLKLILASHLLLHSAEGDLYERALIEGAIEAGLAAQRVAPGSVPIYPSLETAGRAIGPPWQKDHKLAASAAMLLLTTAES